MTNRPTDLPSDVRFTGFAKPGRLLIILFILIIHSAIVPAGPETDREENWPDVLYELLREADERFEGELGVYVKDLASGRTVSLRGDEYWYLASGIKVPAAVEVLRAVDRGEYTLDTPLQLQAADVVDGAGRTYWSPPGTEFTIDHLLGVMLRISDNTASDMVIRLAGIENINNLVRELVPEGMGEITTLADVRRHAYSRFHEDAFNLAGHDFIRLRQETDDRRRMERLSSILGVGLHDFRTADMNEAFEAYYATHLNGGRLSAFGALLERLATGNVLGEESTEYLMQILRTIRTGENRIRAELPADVAFAHKTGTQRGRTCDLGITGLPGEQRVIIAACTRGTLSRAAAERALREVGAAVTRSGLLDQPALTQAGSD